ncbi:ABC transporter ATP-binding protein [Gulosibacter macacae]|uniref:ABC transporter ATP-binding protein n=1 Tax=Gulosibacter macacae TaxID=2488791 RepID=A0A3P3VZJ6_9MICO|nr:ABC transporter ATP-binding protein [Gulosibacter macacae]RRJ88232.1 ABC transporter ATP-binding protein [Gulosibacter macacae]
MTRQIRIRGLAVDGPDGRSFVSEIDASIPVGGTVALIGESGSGKTLSAKTLVGLLPDGFTGRGLLDIDDEQIDLRDGGGDWRKVRGGLVTLVLQDPFTSLSPVHRIGPQIGWTLDAHEPTLTDSARAQRIRDALVEVRLDPSVARSYPHELSGGMRQRAAIAAALAASPRLLIADEPTTALDASNQSEILDLLDRLKRERGLGVLLITHDLGMVRDRSDEVLVMNAGEVVERGATDAVLANPQDDYTRSLISADPLMAIRTGGLTALATAAVAATEVPVLAAHGLEKSFGDRQVLRGVDLTAHAGEIVGIVGESGSGKTTLVRCIAGLAAEDAGTISFSGHAVRPGRADRKPEQAQIVFQDPYSSLNPTFTVGQTLAEALSVAGRPRTDAVELLARVGLDESFLERRPARLSGGQRQRVAIARALAVRPQLLICDESVSALDVSVQARILNLLRELRDELNLAIVLISHDLGVVLSTADRVLVLRDGQVVEEGRTQQVFAEPQHPYTQTLLAAALGSDHQEEPS